MLWPYKLTSQEGFLEVADLQKGDIIGAILNQGGENAISFLEGYAIEHLHKELTLSHPWRSFLCTLLFGCTPKPRISSSKLSDLCPCRSCALQDGNVAWRAVQYLR